MTLYSIRGASPAPLPKQIIVDDRVRSHLSTLSEAELAGLGIVPAAPEPAYDPASEHPPEWDGVNLEWVVRDKTQAELDAEAAAMERQRLSQPLSRVEFQRLFTQAERVKIHMAADGVGGVSQQVAYTVRDFLTMVNAANGIALSDPDVQAGIPALEVAGLIDPGRGAQILAGDPPP